MRHKKGFMLLEVIVSIVVITAGLLTVTLSFSTSKKLVLKSRELFNFNLLLQQKMFDVEQKGESAETDTSGVFKQEDAAFLNGKPLSWSVHVTPVEETNLEAVTLEVYSDPSPGNGHTLETYLRKSKESLKI